MKNIFIKLIIIFVLVSVTAGEIFADNFSKAKNYIRKSETTTNKDAKYEYLNMAKEIYEEEYEKNPEDINVIVKVSNIYQLLGDRQNAKKYIFKAYNISPQNPQIQREMGDFYYSFQEYSTALEYYKLALSSGLLKDTDLNIKTAQCYEKLGDEENAKLYYQITNYLDSGSKGVVKKLNEYDSLNLKNINKKNEHARYKSLYKADELETEENTEKEVDDIIKQLN